MRYLLISHHQLKRPENRRGAVLVVFLVCLAIAAVLIIGTARMALISHQATQTASWSVQARWLAESGVERAANKLSTDTAYTGETWNVSAAELGGEESGVVRIKVEAVAGKEKSRIVRIEADYPDNPPHYARQEKEIIVDLP